MTLKNSIQTDVSAIFLNLDEFAETIVYFFRDGGRCSIPVIVDRGEFQFYSAGDWVTYFYEITLADKCDGGVLREEVNTGGDYVEFKAKNGDAQVTRFSVMRVSESDYAGSYKIALR